jgi:hypothetical protein
MSRMVADIQRSLVQNPREIIVMSFNPEVEVVSNRQVWLERIRTGWNHSIYRAKTT